MRIWFIFLVTTFLCSSGLTDDVTDTKEQAGIKKSSTKVIPSVPRIAIEHAMNKNYEAALPYYRQAVKVDPNNADRHSSLVLRRSLAFG